jgi:exodeoxyribonuclease VII small subunit
VTAPEGKKPAKAAPAKAVPAREGQAKETPVEPAPAQAAASQAAPVQVAPPLPYEQARDQLTELVKRLEAGGLTLEQSLELWERGERLADICAEWLEGARARLATATAARRDDSPADPTAPF